MEGYIYDKGKALMFHKNKLKVVFHFPKLRGASKWVIHIVYLALAP